MTEQVPIVLSLMPRDRELIMELVAKISPPAEILTRYGLTAEGFKAKCKDRMFLAAFKETKRVWESDLNAAERVKKKAGLLLEDMLLGLYRRAQQPETGINAHRDAVETMAKLSDAWEPGKKQGNAAPASHVNITINGAPVITGATVEGEYKAVDK